jgi:formylmethanofuran dehydrogenase subunit E
MRSFDELIKESSSLHGHLCAGQVLGVRMAMAGCREVEIDEPKGCKTLVVYVEIDRCATDAVRAVTGCSLGRRTLKFLDYGKMAATFFNLETGKGVRVVARDEARSLAASCTHGTSNPHHAEREAYQSMAEEDLFVLQPMTLEIPREDLPGNRSGRVPCDRCGEGINFKREIRVNGRTLCIPCAQGSYLPINSKRGLGTNPPKVLLISGRKKVGKTTLIERLVPELSARGYRVGTVKRHHSSAPMNLDSEGKDSWRHRRAGAKAVALVSPSEMALFQNTEQHMTLEEAVSHLKAVDVVLVEGFRGEPLPRIEVRGITEEEPFQNDPDPRQIARIQLEAAGDGPPHYKPDLIRSLVDLIEQRLLR